MLYLSLRQLEYVMAVAHAGSLTVAAQQVNVSQPALSVALTQVETHLGQKLFLRRKGAAITLSAFGRLFLADAEALLADAARLESRDGLRQRRVARIVLGIFEDLAPGYLAPLLRLVRTQYPDIEIRTRVAIFETLADAVIAGDVDVALTYDLGLDARFHRDVFAQVSPQAWLHPQDPLAKRDAVTLADLADLADRPLVLSDQGLSIRHMLGLFRPLGVTPYVAHRAASVEILRSLVANGEGVGISYTNPAGTISHDGRPLVRVPIADSRAQEPIVLVHCGEQPMPLPKIRAAILNEQWNSQRGEYPPAPAVT
ncbi:MULTISPECIES: LysR family transcriptional regulator [unclassified Rhizobium]|uniref:LysR family transcriptional regulator n=1 Tax=unclassified Rhizobium TaxID=2613769 RepID=UPI0006F77973|nr:MULTISPECIES: LysR family transcriptional regulator [unclassified Rhizobium]KQV39972.1 LysR family transcriptional regulator [Rhizobium sp. Root1212]KRD31682.1 LysR family transcriptional regulator [Rhizobium sp. Root268]